MTPLSHQLHLLTRHVAKLEYKNRGAVDIHEAQRQQGMAEILECISGFSDKTASTAQVAEMLDRPRETVLKYIRHLRKAGKLKSVGSGTYIRWKVV